MDLIQKLRETRPSLPFEELLALKSPSVRYEGVDELRDERGDLRRYRVYSIDGHLYDGAPIIIPDKFSALVADSLAEQGLYSTLVNAKEAALAWDDAIESEIIAPATDTQGLTSDQRVMIERILNDRS